MDQWEQMKPELKYFPVELDSPEVTQRLHKLQELSFSLFKKGL
jgi:hypothetical protein